MCLQEAEGYREQEGTQGAHGGADQAADHFLVWQPPKQYDINVDLSMSHIQLCCPSSLLFFEIAFVSKSAAATKTKRGHAEVTTSTVHASAAMAHFSPRRHIWLRGAN